MLIIVVVVAVIIGFFVFSTIKTQRRRSEVQRLNFLSEIDILEKERVRISRDLHDELGPLLSLTRYQLQGLPETSAALSERIDKALTNIDTLTNRMGEIAINLTPSALIKKGLGFALADFFADLEEVTTIDTHLRYEVAREVPESIAIHIYRIVQEISHNTLKHSRAHRLHVHLKEKNNSLFIRCSDDGIGFRWDEDGEEKGIGLKSLTSRTGMLGGKIKCKTAPGEGTVYFFQLPIPIN